MRWLYQSEKGTDGKGFVMARIDGRVGAGLGTHRKTEWKAIHKAKQDYLQQNPVSVAEVIADVDRQNQLQ